MSALLRKLPGNKNRSAEKRPNPGSFSSVAPPSETPNSHWPQSRHAIGADRDHQTPHNGVSQQLPADPGASAPRVELKHLDSTDSCKSLTTSLSGSSGPYKHFTDPKAPALRVELDGSTSPREIVDLVAQGGCETTSDSDGRNLKVNRSKSQGQDEERAEQHRVDATQDLTISGHCFDPQAKEIPQEVENHLAPTKDEMGQSNTVPMSDSNAAYVSRRRSHKQERPPRENSNQYNHSSPRRKASYDELISRITRLKKERAELQEENETLFRDAEDERAKVLQHSRIILQLEGEKGELQHALVTSKRACSRLEKKNNDLLERVDDAEEKLIDRDEQWNVFHDNEIAKLRNALHAQWNKEKSDMSSWHEQDKKAILVSHEKEKRDMLVEHEREKRNMLVEYQEREDAWVTDKATLSSKHQKEKQEMLSEHHVQKTIWVAHERDLLLQHQEEKDKMSNAHQIDMDRRNETHAGETERLKKQHTEENRRLKVQIRAGQQQLASYSSSSSYVAIPDQQLKASFQSLSQHVSSLTALIKKPTNIERITHLDQNGFLTRHAEQLDRSWPKFVRSFCWTLLHEGFFALPLGFGALGKEGEGGEKLGQLRQLFVKHVEGDGSDFSTTGKHANIWRATLFDAILRDVTSTPPSSSEHSFAALFRSNISQVSQRLFGELQKISAFELDTRIKPQVKKICDGLGLLSLQMGTQRAQVLLETVRHGEPIKPDEMFADESNGMGSKIQVDIVTTPCMRRVGDGREDGHTQTIILKGSVVSLKVPKTQASGSE
ncbi:hypothetical protein E8E14_009367 [Neopestalotiopsis sp. 37M]|nr:hypothetical protein E8E14_009367 [Neopestalotiopsis sp. 37M]